MPAAAHRPDLLRGRVFRSRDVIRAGVLTRDALRSSAWRRVFRGVYADAALPDKPAVRIAAASLLMPPTAAFSGRTAAYLLGAEELLDQSTQLQVTVPPGQSFGPVTGLRVRQCVLPTSDVRRAAGHRCTTAVRTALDIARLEPLMDAVPAVDVLLRRGLLLTDELARAADAATGRGSRQARRAVVLVDGRAESRPESQVRVLLSLAGLPAVPQYKVYDAAGHFVARVDFAYPEMRIAIEYDGLWHADTAQFRRDRQRLNRLIEAGWLVLHLTAADLHDPEQLVRRVQTLLRSSDIRKGGL